MIFEAAMDGLGDRNVLALGGGCIGLAFGVFSQRSRFCLRSATLEVAHGRLGDHMAVWLLVFATALISTQALYLLGWFESGAVRQLNGRGSLSGAIVGGFLFGCGMALSRVCASRMVVLSATGNLRALLSGLVFAVVAQAARDGALSPLRTSVTGLWTVDGIARDLLAATGIGHGGGLLFGCAVLVVGAVLAVRLRLTVGRWGMGAALGLTIAAAWVFNYSVAATSFEVVPVHSLSFTSPSADVLMFVLSPPSTKLSFDLGVIPGVALGALIAAALAGELKLEGFHGGASMRRSILGGGLMGFGGVLAGGCEVGAGVSGASIFAATSWIVLWCMWIGAVVTDRLVDRRRVTN